MRVPMAVDSLLRKLRDTKGVLSVRPPTIKGGVLGAVVSPAWGENARFHYPAWAAAKAIELGFVGPEGYINERGLRALQEAER